MQIKRRGKSTFTVFWRRLIATCYVERQINTTTNFHTNVNAMQIGMGRFSARLTTHTAWTGRIQFIPFDASGKETRGWHTCAALCRDDNILANVYYRNSNQCLIRSQSPKNTNSKVQTRFTTKKRSRSRVRRKFDSENFRWARRRGHK